MSYPFRIGIAAVMMVVGLVFLLLGAFELVDPIDQAGKASHLFFSLAAICGGAAAWVAFS
jgi:hypothetical protein